MNIYKPSGSYHRTRSDDTTVRHFQSDVELAPIAHYPSDVIDYPHAQHADDGHESDTDLLGNLAANDQSSPSLLSGRRLGALIAATGAMVSLIINTVAVIWLSKHPDLQSGLVTVFNGNCKKVQQMNIWVHLAINILSTSLLAGSNYCMQCLCAPTRREVDNAHRNGKFLDIGIQSLRNLGAVAKHKVWLWWLLALSSLPIHLMYNSSFYSALATQNYNIFVVTQGFVDGESFTTNGLKLPAAWQDPAEVQHKLNTTVYERLSPRDCIERYAHNLLSNRRHVVIVTGDAGRSDNTLLALDQYTFTASVDIEAGRYEPFSWICSGSDVTPPPRNDGYGHSASCDVYVDKVEAAADTWHPYGFKAGYCLSEIVPEACSFNGNIPIIVVVIVCNVIKALIMFFVAFRLVGNPLVTIGDAIHSFLQRPDPTNKGLCWLTKDHIIKHGKKPRLPNENNQGYVWPILSDGPRQKQLQDAFANASTISVVPQQWRKSASRRRWTWTLLLLTLALLFCTVLLILAAVSLRSAATGATLTSLGFGRLTIQGIIYSWNVSAITDPSRRVLVNIIIANLPQLVLSLLYFHLNGLMTAMYTGREWARFASIRKYLRVSNPRGNQRSTYFLQLPYHIAIPLMTASGLLHWLVSQSLFLAVVAEYHIDGTLRNALAIASCGFSPTAILVTIIVGTLLVVAVVTIGRYRKYDGRMPLVGSCSAAISAACHAPAGDPHAALQKVKYGAITIPLVKRTGSAFGYESDFVTDAEAEAEAEADISSANRHFELNHGFDLDSAYPYRSTGHPPNHDSHSVVQHLCFTSEEVQDPVAGVLYS